MLRIRVDDPAVLAELRDSLDDADCSAVPVSDDTLLVTHPFALDEHEARLELKFLLAAWQAAPQRGRARQLAVSATSKNGFVTSPCW